MGKVYIVGIGPGSKEYVLPLAKKVIQEANVLVGAPRLLSLFRTKKKVICLKGNYSEALHYILKKRYKEKIAVLVSGDPGIFSFSRQITSRLNSGEYEIIPGISTMQLAFAHLGESWEDVFILSLHSRSKRGLVNTVLEHKKIFLFTDRKNNPACIASFLFRKGVQKRQVFVFKNLSLPDEKIIKTDIKSLQKNNQDWGDLCVMVIKK
jgi:precorrin-6y C5,15-methyltransferase (decarboxylating) CbiE subunit